MLEMRGGPRAGGARAPRSNACNELKYSIRPEKNKPLYHRVFKDLRGHRGGPPLRLVAHRRTPPPPGEMQFTLERSARGFVVQFGDGDRVEVGECILRSEQKFRHRVRVQLGREFRARSQIHWSYELVRAGNAAGFSLDHWIPEEVRAREEARFDKAFEEWLEYQEAVAADFAARHRATQLKQRRAVLGWHQKVLS